MHNFSTTVTVYTHRLIDFLGSRPGRDLWTVTRLMSLQATGNIFSKALSFNRFMATVAARYSYKASCARPG